VAIRCKSRAARNRHDGWTGMNWIRREKRYILIRFPDFRSTRAARVYRPDERHWWLVRLQWLAPFVAEIRLWEPELPATAHDWDAVDQWCCGSDCEIRSEAVTPDRHAGYYTSDSDGWSEWIECSWEITTPRSVEPTGRGSMDLDTAYQVLTEWA